MKRLFVGAVGAISLLSFGSPCIASEKITLAEYKQRTINNAYELSDEIMWICQQEQVEKLDGFRETNRACRAHFSNIDPYIRVVIESNNSEEILSLTIKYLDNLKSIYKIYDLETKRNFMLLEKSISLEEH